MASVVGAEEIEIGRSRRADVVLPDVSGPVPAGAQHAGIGPSERVGRQWLAETVDAVPGHVLAGQERGPAHHADGRRDARLRETDAIGCERVEARRTDDPVARGADRIPPCVVDDEDDDVHRHAGILLDCLGMGQGKCSGGCERERSIAYVTRSGTGDQEFRSFYLFLASYRLFSLKAWQHPTQ